MAEKYPTLSPYIYTANNPVVYIDPDGQKIINADRLRSNRAKMYLSRFESKGSIYNNLSRKEIKARYGKTGLDDYKNIKQQVRSMSKTVKTYEKRANKTDEIMGKWAKESPNLYNKIDNMEVDMHLGVDGNRLSDNVFGGTSGPICVDGEYEYRSTVGDNDALDVFINSTVNISKIDEETGEFSLNHEAGHFIFAVENPDQYEQDKITIEAKGEDYNGGHHPDATTGKEARKYGKIKDID